MSRLKSEVQEMKKVAEVAKSIIGAILGEDTPVAADHVRQVWKSVFATR
jgi:hypothetical protein